MAKQTFTAGQVLTAAQMNNLQSDIFNQTTSTKTANYSFVVGDRGTRIIGNGTSITFTVDNSIFTAGDTIKIHNINSTVLTIAAGAGVTVNAAAGLTIAQYQEATLFATSASSFVLFESTASSAQGLTLLNTTSFSAVSSQNITAFSSDYSNYKMVVKFSAFSTTLDVRLRLSASGVDDTSSNYNFGYRYVRSSGANGDIQNNLLNYLLIGYGVSAQAEDCRFTADIVSPFLAERTSIMASGTWNDATSWLSVTGAGAHRVSTSYNGITLSTSTGTFSGIVSIYGYNK